MKLTDSQVVLHWLSNYEKTVKQWVRNRVIEILRFTDSSEWFFISSHNMIADLGTRRVDDLRLVDQNSTWINGFDWMRKDNKEFPIKSLDQIRLSREDLAAIQVENVLKHNLDVTDIQSSDENNVYMAHKQQLYYNESINVYQQKIIPHEVTECYKFSSYLLDPNKHRFRTVVRIMAFVLKFIKLVKTKSPQKFQNNDVNSITLSDEEILAAKEYFFRKATLEVKRFIKPTQYQKISIERDGILYYSGRILPTDNIKITGEMSTVMKDLAADTFCVPIIYKHSPLAYSLINEVHWHSKAAMHSGVETVWRYVLKTGFIIFGRDLVKKIKTQCERYRYLRKKVIDVEMGPISKHSITIAPAFYATQADICSPFKAYSLHHKRTTIKIWLIVYCCISTSTTNIKVMHDYSTQAFIQAFIRFSCKVGYPWFMVIDEGSQLIKGVTT